MKKMYKVFGIRQNGSLYEPMVRYESGDYFSLFNNYDTEEEAVACIAGTGKHLTLYVVIAVYMLM
jgi:hypothetical protein